jgi:hypothetical protein
MATQYAFGKIVTDGLVLALDAADRNSYVSGSATWIDLSGNNNSGSLINGPTFSTANGGSIVFDGSNDYAIWNNTSNLQITVGSISAWVRTSTPGSSYRGIIIKQFAWGLFVKDSVLISYDWGNNQDRSTGINIADNNWKHIAMTFTETTGSPSNNAIIYLNGSPVLTTTIRHSNQTVGLELARGGSGGGGSSQIFNGIISQASIYNRALSANEVTQNYNAQKSRFGL